ncbi:hypothetical protein [Pseudomonas syringae]|uniref:hypothetical protein n=1 Tax=Pseudomonas syringae TaxID=317 RepID=UPI003D15BFB5
MARAFALPLDIRVFGDPPAQADSHGLGFDQAVFAVVGEGLPADDADDFLDQIAPPVVLVFVVAPLFEAVFFKAVASRISVKIYFIYSFYRDAKILDYKVIDFHYK